MTTSTLLASTRRAAGAPWRSAVVIGRQMRFHAAVIGSVPHAVTAYRREVVRLLAEVSLGSGALALIGGTVVIVSMLTVAVGVETGLQGYSQLGAVGVPALTGFFSAYVNTREAAPIIAAIALVATVGGGFTAQLGAMRVSEEIDALEVMGVRSLSYLVSTRVVAGLVAVVPLYFTALIVAYASTKFVVTTVSGQPDGTYSHYFGVFLVPSDVLVSLLKLVIMATVIMLVHCYYGFTATGGPVGVGIAVGRSVRTSLVVVLVVDLLLTILLYGHSTSVTISG